MAVSGEILGATCPTPHQLGRPAPAAAPAISQLRSIVVAAIVAAAVLAPSPAAAQKAEATAAFVRGQQLKRDGKIAEACAAFEASMKLDAQYGTQYNLAICYADLGRTATAWAELDELSSKDPNQTRRAEAARRARALRPRLTSVAIKLVQPAPQLVVTRDEIDVTVLLGAPTPVDPGVHHIVARAPGRREWSTDVQVWGEGRIVEIMVPALEPIAAPRPPSREPAPVAEPTELRPLPPPFDLHPGRGRRIAGIVALCAGAGGLAVGAFYGFRALRRGSDARHECGGDVEHCTGDASVAQHLIDDGRSAAKISNIALAAGGVLAATGVVLYLTAPRDLAAAPLAVRGGVGMVVAGQF